MQRALWTAASGMTAQQLNVDVIANNLANVNTTGFKRSRADFQDALYQVERVPGMAAAQDARVPTGIQVGTGSRTGATYKIFSQGIIEQSNNPYDLAIERGDNNFFQITLPDGKVSYTRDGGFKLDSQGRLVTSDGYLLEPEITIPQDVQHVSIGDDGTVSVTTADGQAQDLGQIQLARFLNPAGLRTIGHNLYLPTATSGDPVTGAPGESGFGVIVQGYIEKSNVKVVEEMVSMIVALRAYEVNSKAIQTADEMLSIANNVRR